MLGRKGYIPDRQGQTIRKGGTQSHGSKVRPAKNRTDQDCQVAEERILLLLGFLPVSGFDRGLFGCRSLKGGTNMSSKTVRQNEKLLLAANLLAIILLLFSKNVSAGLLAANGLLQILPSNPPGFVLIFLLPFSLLPLSLENTLRGLFTANNFLQLPLSGEQNFSDQNAIQEKISAFPVEMTKGAGKLLSPFQFGFLVQGRNEILKLNHSLRVISTLGLSC